jgi:hypothetical protein
MGLTDLFFVRILRGAVVEVVGKWRPLLRALILPAVLMTATSLAALYAMVWYFDMGGSMKRLAVLGYTQFVIWLLLYVLFGMSCHRIILLGEGSLPSRFGIYWTMRETRFMGWVILVGTISMLVVYPFQFATLYLPPYSIHWSITWYVPLVLATYIDGRISMVLPATAVGERSSIVESWRLTRGKGLHIMAALFIAALATDLVGMGIKTIFDGVPIVSQVVSRAINFPLVAVAVGIISVTYRELNKR